MLALLGPRVGLLSRIRERYDQTGDNARAVAYGLRSTGGMITGAALLDATLVRSVLVPASMEVLGRGNWYLPSWLSWLSDLRVDAEE